jgi:23S rRNA pseudouridine2605 synthase
MPEEPRGERLQKILSRAGVASRRAAEDLIRSGRVMIGDRVAVLGDRVEQRGRGTETVRVDGEPISQTAAALYVLLNKPAGHVTTRSDPEGRPTVMDLLPERWRGRLKPVGRLDYGTEGLLLFTDDGDLANRLTHPRFGCSKRYLVKVRGFPGKAAVERLGRGMFIAGRRTAPVTPRQVRTRRGGRIARSSSWWEMELREGRTRQIREMFFRVGHPVQRLRRVAIGRLEDAELRPGSWRELSPGEVATLRTGSGPGSGRRSSGGHRRGPGRR